MNQRFGQQYMNQIAPLDPEYEEFLGRWLAYHRTADSDMRAARAVLGSSPTTDHPEAREKWQRAKMEAVRIVEREEYVRSRGAK